MRDVVYFHGRGSTRALLALALYAVLGAALAMAAYSRRGRRDAAAVAPSQTR